MADGRQLPGFYFDPEQQKYFRIQANHNAATGSKYTVDRVKEQKETSRKRKRFERYTSKLAVDTISPSKTLSASHVKSTFARELGHQQWPSTKKAITATIVDYLRLQNDYSVCACQSCGSRHYVYDFVPLRNKTAVVLGIGDGRSGVVERRSLGEGPPNSSLNGMLTGLTSALNSVNVTQSGMLLATSYSCSANNVAITRVPDSGSYDEMTGVSVLMTVGAGDLDGTCETSSTSPGPNHEQGMVLTSGASGGRAHQLDLAAGSVIKSAVVSPNSVRCIDWLDNNTALIGAAGGEVHLWDLRTSGTSPRYTDEANLWQIRGGGDGRSIWITTPLGLDLYDSRMSRRREKAWRIQERRYRYACQWPHSKPGTSRHGGQQRRSTGVDLATTPHSMDRILGVRFPLRYGGPAMEVWGEASSVAVRGDDNSIMLFSSVDGKLLRTLPPPPRNISDSYWSSRLRTTQDERGRPSLMYNIGHLIRSWTYGVGHIVDHGEDAPRDET